MEEIEVIDVAKKAKEMKTDCCVSDVWFVFLPDN